MIRMRMTTMVLCACLAAGPAMARADEKRKVEVPQFTPTAVNSKQGVACPALFAGYPALCFHGNESAALAKLLTVDYGKALSDLVDKSDELFATRGALADHKAEIAGLRWALDARDVQVRAGAATAAELRMALKSAREAATPPSIWGYVLSAVAGALVVGAVSIGLSYGMRH